MFAAFALIFGLILLVLSADRFIAGAAQLAVFARISPLVIGMVIVGFGTSAPEMLVSTLAAWDNNPGIALGNAYGSNIANICLILGVVALIKPITVSSASLRKELPILLLITLLSLFQLWDARISRSDALVLLIVFTAVFAWTAYTAQRERNDPLASDIEANTAETAMTKQQAILSLSLGLLVLLLSSRMLVWGAVEVATVLGVSNLIIGLTIVAVGTSLPELVSSIAAIRRNEHDLAFGNVLGSNLFNTLAVVGIAGGIAPFAVEPAVLLRDWPLMFGATLVLLVMGLGRRGAGRINRVEGGLLVMSYLVYLCFLVWQSIP